MNRTRHAMARLLPSLWLFTGFAMSAPFSFGQFEAIPDKADHRIDDFHDPVPDLFGDLLDELADPGKKEESANSKRSGTKNVQATPLDIDNSKPLSTKKAAASNPSTQRELTTKDTKPGNDDEEPFEKRFWQYLRANNYVNWAPAPGTSGDQYPGRTPHGEQLKIYMNRMAAGHPNDLPDGSVIVTENYGENQQLVAITVMYRATGYDPKSGNWYWVKYDPDGSVARTPTYAGFKKICGSVNSCIECHSDAGGGDFVFFNDDK